MSSCEDFIYKMHPLLVASIYKSLLEASIYKVLRYYK
jgi:hypothetical protein